MKTLTSIFFIDVSATGYGEYTKQDLKQWIPDRIVEITSGGRNACSANGSEDV